ncbi:MAG: HD domain-containing protein [Bryobacterales bacterium]|nr:HD domain-containing protein [Bryobacterales bacterium]
MRDLLRAACFAADKHAAQRRKGGAAEPYVNHVLEVARLVADALDEPDEPLVMAALLHDTLEDTETTYAELVEKFSEDVASLVAEVTDDTSLSKAERKRLQIEHAHTRSKRAQAIKLADKISNLRSMLNSPPAGWDEARKLEYVEWAREVVAALPEPNLKLRVEFERTWRAFRGL